MKKIIIISVVVGVAVYFLYIKNQPATANANTILPDGLNTVTSNLDDFYNNIVNGVPTNNAGSTTNTTTTDNSSACTVPKLAKVYLNANGEIAMEWIGITANNYSGITIQSSYDKSDWFANVVSAVSPGNIGNKSAFVRNYTGGNKQPYYSPAQFGTLYIRVFGNCRNGKNTVPSNILTFDLVKLKGSSST